MKSITAMIVAGALLWPAAAEAHTLSLRAAKARIQAVAKTFERSPNAGNEVLVPDNLGPCTRRSPHRVSCIKPFEVQAADRVCTLRLTAFFRSHRDSRAKVTHPAYFDCGPGRRIPVPG
jgi:isochorismate hydrolase